MPDLILQHTARHGSDREPGTVTVLADFDHDGDLFIEIEEDDTLSNAWISRKQTRKLRDHLNAVLESAAQ